MTILCHMVFAKNIGIKYYLTKIEYLDFCYDCTVATFDNELATNDE